MFTRGISLHKNILVTFGKDNEIKLDLLVGNVLTACIQCGGQAVTEK